MKAFSPLFCILCVLPLSIASANGILEGSVSKNGLTDSQARALLVIALEKEGSRIRQDQRLEHVQTKERKEVIPGYIEFSLTSDSLQNQATTVLGLFAVGVKSGEIWEVNLCKEISSPEISKIQKQIKQRTQESKRQEQQRRRGLGC